MKNKIKPFLDELRITPYRFWHDTGISRVTAYKLYNDSTYIPGADVLVRICDTYQIQPGTILIWLSEEEMDEANRPIEKHSSLSQDQMTNDSTSQKSQTHSLFHVISDIPESA
jgi:Cro/C1-type HTH DNA-binding domain